MAAAADKPVLAMAVPADTKMTTQANPGNIIWAEKLAAGALGLLRRSSAEAYFANQMAAAIERKDAWRLEYLLTQPLVFRHGLATAALSAEDGMNKAFRQIMWRRKREQKFPALSQYGGMAPLTHAVRQDFAEGVKVLVAQGAGPFAEKSNGRGEEAYYHPALQVALQFGRVDCLKAMFESDGFKKDMAERPARVRGFLMEWGIKGNQVSSLNTLLEHDHQVLDNVAMPYVGFLKKERGQGALDLAISRDVKPAIFDIVFSRKPSTEPAYLFKAIAEHNEHAAAALVNAGVDMEARDPKTGATPLLLAAKEDMRGLVSLLIDKKADTAARDKGGKDVIAYGMKTYREGMVELLLQKASFKPARLLKAAKRCTRFPGMAFALKKAAFETAGTLSDGNAAWQVTGAEQVSVFSRDVQAGFQLAEVFNFATQQHLIVSRDPETLEDRILLREDFGAMKNPKVLETARAHLPKP
ncbi:MAG: hypothetical protein ACAH80_09270 [Alphaproteobacteria bacterium]